MDPEEIADLTRDGSVLLTHPDLPGAKPTAFRPETVPYWLGRGWERYEPPVKPKVEKPAAASRAAKTPSKD